MSVPFTVKRAETDADREQIYRLRYHVFCEEYRYLDGTSYPDGLEFDDWDQHSTHFMALNADGEVVATSRLIGNSALGLRVEEYVPLTGLPRDSVFEVSRLAMRSDLRGHANDVIIGLSKVMFDYSKSVDVTHWVGTMFLGTWKLYLHFGFQFSVTGAPSFWPKHTTNAVVPVAFDLERSEILLRQRNPKLCELFYPHSRLKVTPDEADRVLQQVRHDLRTVNGFRSSAKIRRMPGRISHQRAE